ncbi:hypothetical protein TNCV_1918311 [Trichonephila clavipes]|nr:hypothetical protein TNCV_1918311 [Trichonephila clavipes]
MPSPVQSNCDAHDTIENGQYGAVWSMGHTQQEDSPSVPRTCGGMPSNVVQCLTVHVAAPSGEQKSI